MSYLCYSKGIYAILKNFSIQFFIFFFCFFLMQKTIWLLRHLIEVRRRMLAVVQLSTKGTPFSFNNQMTETSVFKVRLKICECAFTNTWIVMDKAIKRQLTSKYTMEGTSTRSKFADYRIFKCIQGKKM